MRLSRGACIVTAALITGLIGAAGAGGYTVVARSTFLAAGMPRFFRAAAGGVTTTATVSDASPAMPTLTRNSLTPAGVVSRSRSTRSATRRVGQ